MGAPARRSLADTVTGPSSAGSGLPARIIAVLLVRCRRESRVDQRRRRARRLPGHDAGCHRWASRRPVATICASNVGIAPAARRASTRHGAPAHSRLTRTALRMRRSTGDEHVHFARTKPTLNARKSSRPNVAAVGQRVGVPDRATQAGRPATAALATSASASSSGGLAGICMADGSVVRAPPAKGMASRRDRRGVVRAAGRGRARSAPPSQRRSGHPRARWRAQCTTTDGIIVVTRVDEEGSGQRHHRQRGTQRGSAPTATAAAVCTNSASTARVCTRTPETVSARNGRRCDRHGRARRRLGGVPTRATERCDEQRRHRQPPPDQRGEGLGR